MIRLGIIGDYNPQHELHRATDACIPLVESELGVKVEAIWIATTELSKTDLNEFNALLVGTGIYQEREPVLDALRFAREHAIPTLAMCGGFQHMIIEYARNVVGLQEVGHAEFDPHIGDHIIVPLQCSLRGLEGSVVIEPNSLMAHLYNSERSTEKFYCSFGIAPRYYETLAGASLRFVGHDDEGQIRIAELPNHPFFVGTLFVPQASALKGVSHPLINGLLNVARVNMGREEQSLSLEASRSLR